MPAFPCVVMWYLYAESLPASMPHTHIHSHSQDILDAFQRKGSQAMLFFFSCPFFSVTLCESLAVVASLSSSSPPPALFHPYFSLSNSMFYRSVRWSCVWMQRIQFTLSKQTCKLILNHASLGLAFSPCLFLYNLSHTLTRWHSSPSSLFLAGQFATAERSDIMWFCSGV